MSERPKHFTQQEYDDLIAAEGPTCAGWRAGGRTLDIWRHDHPDDERDDYELIMASDGPFNAEVFPVTSISEKQ